MITGPQCRAARALVEFSRDRLAQLSGIDAATIEQFERKLGTPSDEQTAALTEALEKPERCSSRKTAVVLAYA